MSDPAPSPDPHAVRVVFFGPPRSGKSRLLAAVARLAGADAEDAPVDLTPAASGPAGARRDLIPLRLLVDRPGPRHLTGAVLFIDCDGQAAAELLTHADRLQRSSARGALADAVRSADALVLVIDSAWTEGEVEETFRGFAQFLSVLESTRTADREVGGMPVFLTLAKCDTLHQTGEGFTDWDSHIAMRKRELRQRFDDHFDDGGPAGGFLPFGSTDVRLAATATQMPSDEAVAPYADSSGGFGVADLFGEVLAAARDHRDRAVRSHKRLRWTAGLAVGLFAVLLLTLLGLTATGEPGPVEVLNNRVRRLQQMEGPPAVRLAEGNLDRNRREVAALRDSPEFERLPRELRQYVADRDREYAAYAEYHGRFQPPQFAPADVRTQADFVRLGTELAGPLAPPQEYETAWADTEMVRLREKWRADLGVLKRAEQEVFDWFRARITRGGELLLANVPGDLPPQRWRAEVSDTLAQTPPFREAEPVPGSAAVPGRRGAALTFATALRFERSANAVRDWQQVAAKLADTRDLADALGLTQNPEYAARTAEPAAVLQLPPPGDGVDSLALAVTRLELLRTRYTRAAGGAANWTTAHLSGSLRDELGKRLRLAAADGVAHVQRLVRSELGRSSGRGKTAADWSALADRERGGLLLRPELQAWGRLLRLLLRWADPARPDVDPVAELAEFVKKDRFTWDLTRLEVVLPNSLKVRVLKPADDLKVVVTPASGPARVYAFTPGGSPRVDADGVTHSFAGKGGAVVYTPLDGFRAELTLTDGDTKYLLKWADARTPVFGFDALTREPTVESVGPNGVPQRANGVKVLAAPGFGLGVPELLPDTR